MNSATKVRIGLGLLAAAFLLMVAWVSARVGVGLYIDALWFGAAGYTGLFRGMLKARAALGGTVFLGATAIQWGAMARAYRQARFREGGVLANLELDERALDTGVRWVLAAGALFIGLLLAVSAAQNWVVLVNLVHGGPFGASDPVFARDIGFYVFRLPAYAYACKLGLTVLLAAMGLTLIVYYVRGVIGLHQEGPLLPSPVFRHLSLLGAPAIALFSFRFWLARYQVLLNKQGAVFGAGHTDIHARVGAMNLLFVAGMAVAIWVLVNAFLRRRPANAFVGMGFAALWLVAGVLYPWCIQSFVVRPNEWDREKDYIQRNIDFTRRGYGIDTVRVRSWQGDAVLPPDVVETHADTVDNLMLWDAGPLRDLYNQKQRIRSYYEFSKPPAPQSLAGGPRSLIDVDRYRIDGQMRPVHIGLRELALEQLPEKSQGWTNIHLYYTHGYGLCMNLGNRATPGGLPDFLIRDIPPETTRGLSLTEPRVYYGEGGAHYALTATRLDEFDYPGDPDNVFNRYAGRGGVPVGGLARRALLAWYLGDKDILFTGQFTEDSRILLFRKVRARAAKLTPFIFFDEDPYPVLHDGRIVWMLDGYTITRRYPYSEPIGIANYWRNSVKVTIDAYDGTVTYYRTELEDPLIDVFERAFPGVFHPLSEMPENLRQHIRYPKDLFRVQTAIYRKYHVDDPQVFYNGEDVWTFPRAADGEAASFEAPRYAVMALPGAEEPEAEFLLTRTFTVEGKDNMIAWMAGRCDPGHYGELHVLRLPKQRNIYGPNQAKGRFNQDPEVSAFTTLMGQLGSAVISSNVLAVPISDGFLYLQSLFIEDPDVKIPELKQIILGHGDRVVMAPTIDQALQALFSASSSVAETRAPEDVAGAPGIVSRDLRDAYEDARDRLQAGDWAGFGEAFDRLGRLLETQSE